MTQYEIEHEAWRNDPAPQQFAKAIREIYERATPYVLIDGKTGDVEVSMNFDSEAKITELRNGLKEHLLKTYPTLFGESNMAQS